MDILVWNNFNLQTDRKYQYTGIQGMDELFSKWQAVCWCWDWNVVDKDWVHVSVGLLRSVHNLMTVFNYVVELLNKHASILD